jgi:hypothetical protein
MLTQLVRVWCLYLYMIYLMVPIKWNRETQHMSIRGVIAVYSAIYVSILHIVGSKRLRVHAKATGSIPVHSITFATIWTGYPRKDKNTDTPHMDFLRVK